jgi:hypothetical protein
MEDRAQLTDHIEAIAERSPSAGDRLATMLLLRSWPGGSADRTEPAALGWLRRWGPARMAEGALSCSCATGRCAVCN